MRWHECDLHSAQIILILAEVAGSLECTKHDIESAQLTTALFIHDDIEVL